MSSKLTRKQALEYVGRYRLMNKLEIQDLAATTPEQRLRQAAALMRSALVLGWNRQLEAEDQIVRGRWARLRKAYGV